MDILIAWSVLHEFYSDSVLEQLYKQKKYDGADGIKKFSYNAELLEDLARKERNTEKRDRLYAAANAFRKQADIDFWTA